MLSCEGQRKRMGKGSSKKKPFNRRWQENQGCMRYDMMW